MPDLNKPRATLGDLAKEAGVSRSTVSRALRDNPVISKAVRERIQGLAEGIGYRPDPEAARLMSYLKKSKERRFESVIGVLNEFPGVEELRRDPYTAALLEGVIGRAKSLGYAVDFLGLGEEDMTPRRIDQIVAARGIRGVLVPPEPKALFEAGLDWSRIAAVATTTTAQPLKMHRVLPHNFHNIRLILNTLLERGYERVGLIREPDLEMRQMSAPSAIYAQYAHVDHKIKPLPVFNWNWLVEEADRVRHVAAWMEAAKPDVVLGFGTYNLKVIHQATGRKVPDDLGFASYGDCDPSISRLDQQPHKIGAAAVDLLSAHIQRGDIGIPDVPKTTLIEGIFVDGETLRGTH
jgi:LacI family transcriptional regulator